MHEPKLLLGSTRRKLRLLLRFTISLTSKSMQEGVPLFIIHYLEITLTSEFMWRNHYCKHFMCLQDQPWCFKKTVPTPSTPTCLPDQPRYECGECAQRVASCWFFCFVFSRTPNFVDFDLVMKIPPHNQLIDKISEKKQGAICNL